MSEDTFRQRVAVVVVLLFTAHKNGRNISFLCFLSARGRAYRMCVFIWQTTFHFKLLEGSNCGGCLTLIAPHKKLNRCCWPGAGEDEHWKPKSQQSEEAQDPSQIERQITPIGWVCWCTKGGGVVGNEYEYWQANNFIHKQTAESEGDVTPAKQTDAGDAWEGFMEFIYGQHQQKHQEQRQRWLHVCER